MKRPIHKTYAKKIIKIFKKFMEEIDFAYDFQNPNHCEKNYKHRFSHYSKRRK